jgi:hypothetical protein
MEIHIEKYAIFLSNIFVIYEQGSRANIFF